MHITIPQLIARPDNPTEQLKAQLGILRIECRSLCEQLEQRRIAYDQTLAERDAFSKAYTAAQLQLSAMCERNDELNLLWTESHIDCKQLRDLLRCAVSVSVIGPELRGKITAALDDRHD